MNPYSTIHHYGIKRNKEQKRDFFLSFLYIIIYLILLWLCCSINFFLGGFFFFTIPIWGCLAQDSYDRSITPTEEQLQEYYRRERGKSPISPVINEDEEE